MRYKLSNSHNCGGWKWNANTNTEHEWEREQKEVGQNSEYCQSRQVGLRHDLSLLNYKPQHEQVANWMNPSSHSKIEFIILHQMKVFSFDERNESSPRLRHCHLRVTSCLDLMKSSSWRLKLITFLCVAWFGRTVFWIQLHKFVSSFILNSSQFSPGKDSHFGLSFGIRSKIAFSLLAKVVKIRYFSANLAPSTRTPNAVHFMNSKDSLVQLIHQISFVSFSSSLRLLVFVSPCFIMEKVGESKIKRGPLRS